MNTLALSLLWALVRTGIVLSLSAVAVAAFLRLFHVASPTVRRTAYVAVLLQGWLVFEGPFSLPLPSAVSKAVDWPAVADRVLQIRALRVALAARPPVSPRVGRPSNTGGQAASATQHLGVDGRIGWDKRASANEILRGETGANGNESVCSGSIAGSNTPHEGAAAGPSTLAVDGEWKSIASQKSTGGPKLPPVAPEQVPTESVAAVVEMPPTDARPFPWPLALASLWVAGIFLIAGRSAWAYMRFARRFPASCETPVDWADEWTSLQLEAGLRGTVPLVVAEHAGPVLCRLPRGYRLIVPAEAWRTLEQSQRLLILRHELAHIERRDVWKSLAMRILALPHWFNPLVWHIVRRFDESAEWACDETAAGAAPDRVPDYARALLQLSHRAQPAFFAAPAARTHGLAQRIRRLLTPAANKGTKMKTTVMAALLLGISLVNVARLQTRAEGNSSADDDKVRAPRATPAAAEKPAATKHDSKTHRHPVTVQVPVTKTIMVPVTTTEMVPQQVFVEPSIDAPPAIVRPVAEPLGVVASTPLQTRGDEQGPSADNEKTKTPPPVAVPPAPPAKTPSAAKSSGAKAAPDVPQTLRRFNVSDTRYVPRPEESVEEIFVPREIPREARVNLPYILERMHRFQREQEELKASLAEMEKWQETEGNRIAVVNKRLEEEKDPVVRSFLEKGLSQKTAELQREDQGRRDKLLEREMNMRGRNLQRIADEIARYANQHKILVVRRMPFANEMRAGTVPAPVSASVTLSPEAPLLVTPPVTRTAPGTAAVPPLPPPAAPPLPKGTPAGIAAFRHAVPWPTAPQFSFFVNPPEVVYVAEVHGELIPDISDEIVKRLNAADAAKGKPSSATPK